jgi:hypothetical protein
MYQLLEGAARTYLLWLNNTQNGALRDPPVPIAAFFAPFLVE